MPFLFIVRYNGHIASESIEKVWTIFDRIVNCGRIKLKGITMKGDEKWSTMPGRKTAADAGKR